MKKTLFLLFATWCCCVVDAPAQLEQTFYFPFDNAPLYATTPLDVLPGVIAIGAYPTAYVTSSAGSYAIENIDYWGYPPAGFSGYCLSPTSMEASDLLISFDMTLGSFSIMYSPAEYGTSSSATMEISGYYGTNLVGSNTATIANTPGTWPTGTLGFTNQTQTFDSVVIHYLYPPATGGNYLPIFMVDNMTVTLASPLPTNMSVLLLPDNEVAVFWPSSWSPDWHLLSNTNLANPDGWVAVTNTPILTYPVYHVTLPMAPGGMFFRMGVIF